MVATDSKTSQLCVLFDLLNKNILKVKRFLEFTPESFVGIRRWFVSIRQFQKLRKAEKSFK